MLATYKLRRRARASKECCSFAEAASECRDDMVECRLTFTFVGTVEECREQAERVSDLVMAPSGHIRVGSKIDAIRAVGEFFQNEPLPGVVTLCTDDGPQERLNAGLLYRKRLVESMMR